MRRLIVPALIALLANLGQSATRGQTKPDLPKADTVLQQYVEATGGEAARKKLTNRVSTDTVELKGANGKGTIKVTEAAPNKVLIVTNLGPNGETKQGTDGKDAWEYSSINGDRDMTGDEKETFVREAGFYKDLHWKDIYSKVECVGIEDVDGKPAHKIVLTPKSGKPMTQYFDKTSHLLVKQASTAATPMGEITVEIYPSDYKAVDGVQVPFTLTQKVLTQEILVKLTDVKQNVDVPADTFRRPAAPDEPAKKKAE